jgi:hypothetical protein
MSISHGRTYYLLLGVMSFSLLGVTIYSERPVASILILEYAGNGFFRNAGNYQSKLHYNTVILKMLSRPHQGTLQSHLCFTDHGLPPLLQTLNGLYQDTKHRRHLATPTFLGKTPKTRVVI